MRFFLSLLFFGFLIGVQAQERVTTVGLQFKPMLPVTYLNADQSVITSGVVDLNLNNTFGYAAGMSIRHGLTDRFAVESGLGYVRRNYSLVVDDDRLNLLDTVSYSIIGYEIPTMGLVYIQLSREIFMNAAFGFSFDFYPTDVGARSEYTEVLSLRRSWVKASLLANLGWEFRTRKSGVFYLGGSFHRPFGFTYRSRVIYDDGADLTTEFIDLSGIYLTVDLRYYFHEKAAPKNEQTKRR